MTAVNANPVHLLPYDLARYDCAPSAPKPVPHAARSGYLAGPYEIRGGPAFCFLGTAFSPGPTEIHSHLDVDFRPARISDDLHQ